MRILIIWYLFFIIYLVSVFNMRKCFGALAAGLLLVCLCSNVGVVVVAEEWRGGSEYEMYKDFVYTPLDLPDDLGEDGKVDPLWYDVRGDLIDEYFGMGKGVLPNRSVPDYVVNIPGPHAKGCYCAYFGRCDASDCQWSNNMTQIVWTTEVKVNDSYTLRLNSTVFHTLNTSGVAPQIYPPVGPVAMPDGGFYGNATRTSAAFVPQKRSDTLVIFHHGHSQPCDQCWIPWIDQTSQKGATKARGCRD